MLTGILYCGHCRSEFVALRSPTKPPYGALVKLTEPVEHLHPITREKLVLLEDYRLDTVKWWYNPPVLPKATIYGLLGMTPEEYARWLLGDDYHEQGRRKMWEHLHQIHAEEERQRKLRKKNRWHYRVARRIKQGIL